MPNPVGFETQSIASGVVGMPSAVPAGADAFKIRVELATCRWLTSATPNASVGFLITPADPPLYISRPSLAAFHLFPLVGAAFTIEYYNGADQYKL